MNFKTIMKFLVEKRSKIKVYILYGSLSMKSQKGETVKQEADQWLPAATEGSYRAQSGMMGARLQDDRNGAGS